MKKIVFIAGLTLLFATSCNKETINNEVINTPETPDRDTLVPVHVHVNDFSVTQEDFPVTRSNTQTPAASGVKTMTLAFYNGDAEVYKTTQLKDDATTYITFGDFECALPKGSYTMVVLGYGYFEGDELALTSPTQAAYTTDHTRETFTATQTINITTNEDVVVSATLSRIVALLHLASSDVRTEEAANIRMTFSAGGKAFNPTTGLATVNTGFSNTVGINKPVGEATGSATYIFLDSDEQTMDVTIDVLNAAGNSITHRVITNVPFKRNRSTKVTGPLYSAPLSTSFLLDTDWLTETVITF
jgi:hypothetical protein